MKRIGEFVDAPMRRYVRVGVLNMLVCTGLMYLLYNLTGLNSLVCALINHALGGVISYFFNRSYVFRAEDRSPRQAALFVLNLCVCYCIAYSIAVPAVEALLSHWSNVQQDNLAMGVGVLLFSVLNYFGQRYLVFRNGPKREQKTGAE